MSSTEDQVFVKLVDSETNNGPSVPENDSDSDPNNLGEQAPINTSNEVLSKLISANVGSPASGGGGSTFILYIPGFRKIEPKVDPKDVKEDREENEEQEKDGKAVVVNPVTRLLGINPTKRGVKACPRCFKSIGYRAKQCKHCSPSKKARQLRAQTALQVVTDSLAKQVAKQAQQDSKINEGVVTETGEVEIAVCQNSAVTEQETAQEESRVDMTMLVSNEAEISTTENQKLIEEKDKDDIQVIEIESVPPISVVEETVPFIPGKDQVAETPHPVSDKLSLQDLICGLLAQNQASLPIATTVAAETPAETTTIAVQTEPEKQSTTDGREYDGEKEEQPLEGGRKEAFESSVDAQSVALFLGQMAQRNGKKRHIAPNILSPKTVKATARLVQTGLSGMQAKPVISLGLDVKPAKFRKIQPKGNGEVSAAVAAAAAAAAAEEVLMAGEVKDELVEVKYEGQTRLMDGNATRRGVMECIGCHRMIGCRSKTCKHCKTQVAEEPPRPRRGKIMCQAMELHLPKDINIKLFSVRKCKTGPELRCFVRMEGDTTTKTNAASWKNCSFLCDYPLCVTSKEIGNKSFICEHAKACCSMTSRGMAEIPQLDPKKLVDMPISQKMKDAVRQLNEHCNTRGVPLVQYVSSKTLAVIDQLQSDDNNSFLADSISFAHVRFDHIKGQGCFQRQVFCSGKSCMAWNFISSHPEIDNLSQDLMRLCSCTHYAACLWAIASDSNLDKDFGEYLNMFESDAELKDRQGLAEGEEEAN